MESDNGKKVLITGGAGYVGQVLLQNIPDSWKTTVIDNVYVGNQDFSPSNNMEFVKGDIRNESLMEELITKNDAVIHLAGIVGDSCPKNPKSAEEVNVDATEKIAKFCKKSNKRLVFMSTCSVYGFNEKTCDENTDPNPLNAYSHHKVLGENVIKENVDDYIIFRMGTVLAIGTSLFQIVFVTLNVSILHATFNFSVDLILAIFLLIGGVIGAQYGSKFTSRFKGEQIRVLLAIIVLGVCTKMGIELVSEPLFNSRIILQNG